MENNNNLNPLNELNAEETKVKKSFRKEKKQKLIRNQALLKRGSYSLAITAVVIIGVIVFNILFSALAKRIDLEFDITPEKLNSISEENVKFIKGIEKEIDIIFCAEENAYVDGYMSYYAQQYGITSDATEYYKQTIKLVNKYDNYNDNINVRFVDTQSTQFAEISKKYAGTTLNYGDILVSCDNNGTERFKKIGYTDIYQIAEDNTYAAYGYSTSAVSGNNIETALTGAISYVTSAEEKNIAILSGHSKNDYTEKYVKLLVQNNYTVDVIEDKIIKSIPDKYDAIVIAAPTNDFAGDEIIAISEFLKNKEQLNKGLIYFADASCPYLPNFADFLTEWGIVTGEGVLFETDENYQLFAEKTTVFSLPTGADDITSEIGYGVTGLNVPFSLAFEQKYDITVTPLMATSPGTVAAPLNVTNDWNDFGNYTKQSYPTVIQAESYMYNDDNEEVRSYVMAFSSIEFIYSDLTDYQDVSNNSIVFSVSERAVNAHSSSIFFDTKTITNESFTDKVTESSVKTLRTIFVIILPLVIVVAGIYIYIKRRNA